MKNKKFIALILSAAMVFGSSMAVFAADGADSEGTIFDHVNKDVIDVTLPTDQAVQDVFDYYVDPEGLIKSAGTLADGATTVSGNDDGVYFKNSVSGGNAGYSSSSDEVKFEGKNSVDVDVTVAVTVTATDAAKDIALVADQDALDAATGPALLMTLKVGSDSAVITSAGATAKETVAGVPDNFEVKGNGSEYVYGQKGSGLAPWNSTTVQLSGKTNSKDVPTGAGAMTVPKITLTWTVSKSGSSTQKTAYGRWTGSTVWIGVDAETGFSASNLTVEVSDGGTTYKTLATNLYSVNEANWVSTNWANIVTGLGGDPSGTVFIRITDGTTQYVFENK